MPCPLAITSRKKGKDDAEGRCRDGKRGLKGEGEIVSFAEEEGVSARAQEKESESCGCL